MDKLKRVLKNRVLMKKIGWTVLILFIFRLGNNIFISSVSPSVIGGLSNGLELYNLMTAADLTTFSIFSLGLSGFITASIIIELLANDVIPAIAKLKKENDTKKINSISNTLGVVLSIIQALGITLMLDNTYGILKDNNIYSYIYTVVLLVTGSCTLLWLSKQIDNKGIGNGSSVIIAGGILYKLPALMSNAFDTVVTYKDYTTFILFGLLMIAFFSVLFFVVFVEKSERKIPIQFSSGVKDVRYKSQDYLPIKVNVSGVIPVIFASSLLQIPTIFCTLLNKSPDWLNYISLTSVSGIIIYSIMIILFLYYYSHIIINPKDVNKQLQKSGANIAGVRLGKDTESFINRVLNRVNVYGAIAIVIIALIPVVLPMLWETASISNLTIGGTSLIIVTGVGLEIAKSIKTETSRKDYRKESMFWRG